MAGDPTIKPPNRGYLSCLLALVRLILHVIQAKSDAFDGLVVATIHLFARKLELRLFAETHLAPGVDRDAAIGPLGPSPKSSTNARMYSPNHLSRPEQHI